VTDGLAAEVGRLLKANAFMLVTAESCTGGGVAQAVTEIAGSSAWFERGYVTYSNLSKQQLLGVRESTLAQHGAVSEVVVREMVEGALGNSCAQLALAVSGIAGPDGGTPEKPVGTVWFAWGVSGNTCTTALHNFSGSRADIRTQAVQVSLRGIIDVVKNLTAIV